MPQENYVLTEFNWDKSLEKLRNSSLIVGDLSDEEIERCKGKLCAYIKVKDEKVSFHLSLYGKLQISNPNRELLRRAKSKLRTLLVCLRWIPTNQSEDSEIIEELKEKVKDALESFRLLYCRWPYTEEIALNIGVTPEEARKILYKLAASQPLEDRWREPTREDVWSGQKSAYERLKLAALINRGYKESIYVAENWSKEEIRKAEEILKRYPQFVPQIDISQHKDSSNVKCEIYWPKITKHIIGDHYPSNLIDPKGAIENIKIKKSDIRLHI